MPITQQQTVDFACPVSRLYAYVTQPWRWHEWHPSSRSAHASVEVLKAGDTFDEVIELQPFAPLPVRLRRETHYRVDVADIDRAFEVHGRMRDGWLTIRYDFAPIPAGTRFVRTLTFDASGASRWLKPLLRRRQESIGRAALAGLKRRMESDTPG
jgi:hypothetical protein